jgi:hypothetical protein
VLAVHDDDRRRLAWHVRRKVEIRRYPVFRPALECEILELISVSLPACGDACIQRNTFRWKLTYGFAQCPDSLIAELFPIAPGADLIPGASLSEYCLFCSSFEVTLQHRADRPVSALERWPDMVL